MQATARGSMLAGAPYFDSLWRFAYGPVEATRIMFGIGMPELAVILVIALLVLGPKRLPEVAKGLGKALAELRRATSGISEELENARIMLEEETRQAERALRDGERMSRARETAKTDPPTPPDAAVETAEAAPDPAATPPSSEPRRA